MKKIYIFLVLFLVAFSIMAPAKSVKWVYQGAIDTTNGLTIDTSERAILAASDSRGVVYYATYQNLAGDARDVHVYKLENILNPATRSATILDTLSSVSVWNQYYGLTTDTANNVYVAYYHTASPFGGDTVMRKYDQDGNIALGFESNGTLRPPIMNGLEFRGGALTYQPSVNKLIVSGMNPSPNTQYTGRLVGLDANSGVGIDTSFGVSTSSSGAVRYIRGMTYDEANNYFFTLNQVGLLERWGGGTPSNLNGYVVDSVLMNYNSSYGVRLQLSFDPEFKQTYASVSSAVPERYYISVLDLDSCNEIQRLTADSTVGPYAWCAGSCLIGSGNNKRLIALDFPASKMHIYAPELPQIAPSGYIIISRGVNRDLSASLGTEPYTWSIATVSGSPGTLNAFTGDVVTFLNNDTGSCIVRCTDANGLYSEVTINVVPTSAPLFNESVQANRSRLED